MSGGCRWSERTERARYHHSIRRYQTRKDAPIVSGERCFALPPRQEPRHHCGGAEDAAGDVGVNDSITSWIIGQHDVQWGRVKIGNVAEDAEMVEQACGEQRE